MDNFAFKLHRINRWLNDPNALLRLQRLLLRATVWSLLCGFVHWAFGFGTRLPITFDPLGHPELWIEGTLAFAAAPGTCLCLMVIAGCLPRRLIVLLQPSLSMAAIFIASVHAYAVWYGSDKQPSMALWLGVSAAVALLLVNFLLTAGNRWKRFRPL